MDIALDLHSEYEAIMKMYHKHKEEVPAPIQAFFGDLLGRPIRKKAYPIALINHKVNMDQLLAINNAMKYPVAYIQGPPGTGKTNTIINTIVTAFFNEKTVLLRHITITRSMAYLKSSPICGTGIREFLFRFCVWGIMKRCGNL